MSTTDILNLNTTQMFEKIRSGLPIEVGRTQNLLECKDDMLYAWNSSDSCLMVVNWRAAKLKGFNEIKHQILIPSVQQTFQVDRVLSSIEGSLIALAGSHGVTLLELPRRWGPNGQFMEGKEVITCRSSNLDAQFFHNNPHTEVRQLRWHPASPTDSHLLVLLSDNTIRVYDNFNLRHVWQVGPFPSLHNNSIHNSSSLPIPYVLGESAVDFDICPPISSPNDTSQENISIRAKLLNEKVEWPIVILRENGNIYILSAGIDTDKPRLQGPLTIKPETDNNYGLDSCSILVIPSLPPTVIIAETTGKLHHALLLEAKTPEDSFNEIDSSLVIHPSEWTIHVLETVELELGIPEVRSNVGASYTCPIHLKSDSINEIRYFAYHNAGLHVVTVNFIEEMERYLDSDVVSELSTFSNNSRAEYLVCTKINKSNKVNAILGFVLLQMPSGIVLLLSSGQVINLNLVIDSKLLPLIKNHEDSKTSSGKINSLNEKLIGPSFVDHIKNVLKRSVTQPIVSINKSAQPSPQEMYELLTQTMDVLRSEYLKKHEQVRGEFLQKLNAIRLRKEQQKKDIESLERERDLIRENAHRLAERFEEINENQELLSKKCQNLMRLANTCLPSNSQDEEEFFQEVEKINKQTKLLTNTPQKAKATITKQCYHIQKYTENNKNNKPFDLPGKQEATLKEILLQMTAEIEGQIAEVKRINNILSL